LLLGGSGGGIAWEILALEPKLAQNFIPIATDWKATDWLIANCYLQEQILNNSKDLLRMRVFICYATDAGVF
jgi:homoserine acetyltransferase